MRPGARVFDYCGKQVFARRLVPGLSVAPRWRDQAMFREIFAFSGKTVMEVIAKLLQYQTAPIIIARVLGPGFAGPLFAATRSHPDDNPLHDGFFARACAKGERADRGCQVFATVRFADSRRALRRLPLISSGGT